MPVIGRAQCWSFTLSTRGYFAACVMAGLARRWTRLLITFGGRATSTLRPRSISAGLAVSATGYRAPLEHAPISQSIIDAFLDTHPTKALRASAHVAIEVARRVVPECFAITGVKPDPHQTLLDTYADYLRQVRGIAPKTCEGLLLAARRILGWHDAHCPKHPACEPERRTGPGAGRASAQSVRQHPDASLDHNQPSYISAGTSVVRLQRSGPCPLRAANALLSASSLASSAGMGRCPARDRCGRRNDTGWRTNRAILLLTATTGLRNKEFRSLGTSTISGGAVPR